MGGIGKKVAKRSLAFDMKIQYHNHHPLPSSTSASSSLTLDATYVSFSDLLSTSDIISLNLALTHETTHILGAAEFEQVKKGVVMVNTARGGLIDKEAIIHALKEGKMWSVGLDVFENEPHVDGRLLTDERVVISPHIGAPTVETMAAMERLVIENIRSALLRRS
ncbi:D-isomer specific 2-hydroxyacid dehydrogenase [Halenospora varia]|nr:D-isomer specific 2-hydroxyacid dehydrogenase [Halenospora varia]